MIPKMLFGRFNCSHPSSQRQDAIFFSFSAECVSIFYAYIGAACRRPCRPLFFNSGTLIVRVLTYRFSFSLFLIDIRSHAHFSLLFLSSYVAHVVRWPTINRRSFYSPFILCQSIIFQQQTRRTHEMEQDKWVRFKCAAQSKWQKLSACFHRIYFSLLHMCAPITCISRVTQWLNEK